MISFWLKKDTITGNCWPPTSAKALFHSQKKTRQSHLHKARLNVIKEPNVILSNVLCVDKTCMTNKFHGNTVCLRILHCWLGDMSDVIRQCVIVLDWNPACVTNQLGTSSSILNRFFQSGRCLNGKEQLYNYKCHIKQLMNASRSVEFAKKIGQPT